MRVATTGQQTNVPVKMILPNGDPTLPDSVTITAELRSIPDGQVILSEQITLPIKLPDRITLTSLLDRLVLIKGVAQSDIPIRVICLNTRQEPLTLAADAWPPGMLAAPVVHVLPAGPPLDTVLTFRVKAKKAKHRTGQDRLYFRLSAVNGEAVGQVSLSAVSFGDKGKYVAPVQAREHLNYVEIGRQSAQGNADRWYSNGDIAYWHEKGEDRLRYMLVYDQRQQQTRLLNTRYRLERGGHRLILGNQYIRSEAPLYGRGILYSRKVDQQRTQFGWVNGAGNLLHPNWATRTLVGNSLLATYDHLQEGRAIRGLETVFRHRSDALSWLVGGYTRYGQPDHRLLARLTGSLLYDQVPENPVRLLGGGAAELQYYKRSDRWSWQADQYYATPNYTGLRSGQLLLNQKAIFRPSPPTRLEAGFQYRRFQDRRSTPTAGHRFVWQQPRLSFSRRLTETTRLRASAFWLYQASNNIDLEQSGRQYLSNGYFVEPQLNWSHQDHYLQLSAMLGQYTFGEPQEQSSLKPAYHFRLYWSFRSLEISARYEYGGFYLLTQWREFVKQQQQVFLSVEPRIHISLLNERVTASLYGQLAYDKYRHTWTVSGAARLQCYVLNGLALVGEHRQVHTANYFGNFWSAAIRKDFTTYRHHQSTYRLSLHLFYDDNANGIQEADEPSLENLHVSLGDRLVISDEHGQVSYHRLPQGTYLLRVVDIEGRFIPISQQIVLTGTTQLTLPLNRNAVLRGRVIEERERFAVKSVNLGDFTVVAKDPNGRLYQSVVMPNGEFTIYLPVGSYELYLVDKHSLETVIVENNHRRVTVTPEVILQEQFHVKAKRRRTNIRQFRPGGD